MNRKNVLLLFGGESSEHEVSIASAKNVLDAIDTEKYSIDLVFISKEGKWYLVDSFDAIDSLASAVELLPVLGSKTLVTLTETKRISPDVIFPILHGEHGEDGTIQGLASLLHIPIVGAGIDASVMAIDKDICKRILIHAGIPVVPYQLHRVNEELPDFNELSKILGETLFVKPARLGSSVGVSKVHTQQELVTAIDLAHTFDPKVLIEQSIIGKELEVGILGNIPDIAVSTVGEIQPDREFYSYESKYDPTSTTKVIIPANIDSEIIVKVQDIATEAYRAIEGSGLSRIDFFLTDDEAIYLNEINTLPGFTNISMYPKLWQHEGIEYSELIDKLIELALKREGVV
jgi:D-alanine-D-alanine ligase